MENAWVGMLPAVHPQALDQKVKEADRLRAKQAFPPCTWPLSLSFFFSAPRLPAAVRPPAFLIPFWAKPTVLAVKAWGRVTRGIQPVQASDGPAGCPSGRDGLLSKGDGAGAGLCRLGQTKKNLDPQNKITPGPIEQNIQKKTHQK